MRNGKLTILGVVTLLSACAGGPAPISSGERYAASNVAVETYLLGAGDKVRITIYNEPALTGDYSIASDGTLSLPLIGNVPAIGQTTTQLAADVQRAFADGYLNSPKVSAEVITYRPFYILGEVKSPGQYPYMTGLTAYNAIATAQGFTPRARKSRVFIRRFGETAELEYALTPDLRIWPGDTVRLGERYF